MEFSKGDIITNRDVFYLIIGYDDYYQAYETVDLTSDLKQTYREAYVLISYARSFNLVTDIFRELYD